MNQLVTSVRNRQWLAMVRQRKESGLTIKDWCEQNGVSQHAYYYRLRMLREQAASADPVFAELTPPAEVSAVTDTNLENLNSTAVLRYKDLTIGLSNQASADLIANIVRALHA